MNKEVDSIFFFEFRVDKWFPLDYCNVVQTTHDRSAHNTIVETFSSAKFCGFAYTQPRRIYFCGTVC